MPRPIHDPEAVASFYHLHGPPTAGAACRGLACFANRAADPGRWRRACSTASPLYCLGLCHAAPAAVGTIDAGVPSVRCAAPVPVLLGTLLDGPVRDLDEYLACGGGRGIDSARALAPSRLIDIITESGLRGRGGAGFPAGRKWAAFIGSDARPVLVVNADEGDPGAFGDKLLIEQDPFRLIEGIAVAAHAIGAVEAVIYLRCEYPAAAETLTKALAECAVRDWPGGVGMNLHSGKGSYLCGEETALLNALESRRPFARARPPFPFQQGLNGRPTLVHNVETLCAIPWIVAHGAAAYRALGSNRSTGDPDAPTSAGTKLVSLNSLFRNPGLVEVAFGTPLRTIVEDIGGGLVRGRLIGVMVGGPLAGLLPPVLLDTPFTYEDLAAVGGSVGHGGVIAFSDETALPDLIAEVFRFGAGESCGLCTPCHLGTAELAGAFARPANGRAPISGERSRVLVTALEFTSLCGHGGGLAAFARSLERHYPDELAACLS